MSGDAWAGAVVGVCVQALPGSRFDRVARLAVDADADWLIWQGLALRVPQEGTRPVRMSELWDQLREKS